MERGGKEFNLEINIYLEIYFVHRNGGKELNIFIRSDEAVLTLHIIMLPGNKSENIQHVLLLDVISPSLGIEFTVRILTILFFPPNPCLSKRIMRYIIIEDNIFFINGSFLPSCFFVAPTFS